MNQAATKPNQRPSSSAPTLVAGADAHALAALDIRRLETDSRRIKRGNTFVACPGERSDGRDYIAAAIARGARSVLWEKSGFRWNDEWRVPNVGVDGLRAKAGVIASRVYGDPSSRLWTVGITGTNGKTTCSQWVAHALALNGKPSAVIGTLGYGLWRDKRRNLRPLINTTPEAVWLHAQLARFSKRGARAASMEVSSIGLDQGRVAGVQFDVAVFTNLTRDHIDYHGSMRQYRESKARLFDCPTLKSAVINVDDAFGAELARRLARRGRAVIRYGFTKAARHPNAVVGSDLVADVSGVRFSVATPWGTARISSSVLGRFNASNLLATLAVLLASGVKLGRAAATLKQLKPVSGRMQTLGGGVRPLVVVDYAHTPDALKQVLCTLRDLSTLSGQRRAARLVCVFGCGGNRDRGKRPLMGRLASRLADHVVLTTDNPRDESPRRIIADIRAGMSAAMRSATEVEFDRRHAIRRALAFARRGDVVLIAGKGHETYQEARGVRRPFSDIKVAREELVKWRAS